MGDWLILDFLLAVDQFVFSLSDVHHWKDGKQGTRKQQIVDLVRLNPEDVKLIFIVLITFVITHYSFRGDLSS